MRNVVNGVLLSYCQRTVHSLLGKGASMGVSYLRFLPKAASLRSIVSMSRRLSPTTAKVSHPRSTSKGSLQGQYFCHPMLIYQVIQNQYIRSCKVNQYFRSSKVTHGQSQVIQRQSARSPLVSQVIHSVPGHTRSVTQSLTGHPSSVC